MLRRHNYQSVIIDVLGFEGGHDLAQRVIDEVNGLDERLREILNGAIGITSYLLGNGDCLEVAAEEGWRGREAMALDFRIGRSFAIDPVKKGIDVEFVVGNCSVDFRGYSVDLRKVTDGQTLARRTTNNVICRVFIGVGSLLATGLNKFKDRVYTEATMRVYFLTCAVDSFLR